MRVLEISASPHAFPRLGAASVPIFPLSAHRGTKLHEGDAGGGRGVESPSPVASAHASGHRRARGLGGLPPNVLLIDRYLNEVRRQHLQATHGIHVCPSESEGYGHTIAEGMALGAVVVTTNTPPIDELVGRDRGYLVAASRQKPMGLDHA